MDYCCPAHSLASRQVVTTRTELWLTIQVMLSCYNYDCQHSQCMLMLWRSRNSSPLAYTLQSSSQNIQDRQKLKHWAAQPIIALLYHITSYINISLWIFLKNKNQFKYCLGIVMKKYFSNICKSGSKGWMFWARIATILLNIYHGRCPR